MRRTVLMMRVRWGNGAGGASRERGRGAERPAIGGWVGKRERRRTVLMHSSGKAAAAVGCGAPSSCPAARGISAGARSLRSHSTATATHRRAAAAIAAVVHKKRCIRRRRGGAGGGAAAASGIRDDRNGADAHTAAGAAVAAGRHQSLLLRAVGAIRGIIEMSAATTATATAGSLSNHN